MNDECVGERSMSLPELPKYTVLSSSQILVLVGKRSACVLSSRLCFTSWYFFRFLPRSLTHSPSLRLPLSCAFFFVGCRIQHGNFFSTLQVFDINFYFVHSSFLSFRVFCCSFTPFPDGRADFSKPMLLATALVSFS